MLGRTLFFDPILSGSKLRSCSSCHNPGLSWADGQPRAIGENQQPLKSGLRTPTLLNVAWTPKLGWDGHFSTLEGVAIGPITAPDNMNLPADQLVARLSAIPGYVGAFDAAFGKGDISVPKIEQSLATFERSIVSDEAPFDRWIKGDETRSTRPPSAASRCSTAREIARPATAAGLSPTRRFTTSASPRTTISGAAGCFRHR